MGVVNGVSTQEPGVLLYVWLPSSVPVPVQSDSFVPM